jgi:hypothetical protein
MKMRNDDRRWSGGRSQHTFPPPLKPVLPVIKPIVTNQTESASSEGSQESIAP